MLPDQQQAARALVAAQLSALDGVDLIDYADGIDPPSNPVVMLRLDHIEPHPEIVTPGARRYRFGLVVITPRVQAGPADDQLEAATERVLAAVDAADTITWTTAERGVYASSPDAPGYPCMTVTTQADLIAT